MAKQAKLEKFELNYAGVGELLKSGEMKSALISYANQVANRAGAGYVAYVAPTRAVVSVETGTEEAYRDNLENNTLEKAIRS